MTTSPTTDDGRYTRHIRICLHCGARYDWRRSPSASLKMTYCGSICEGVDLGFTIEALLTIERAHTPPPGLGAVELPLSFEKTLYGLAPVD
jgi:hypothetical protein